MCLVQVQNRFVIKQIVAMTRVDHRGSFARVGGVACSQGTSRLSSNNHIRATVPAAGAALHQSAQRCCVRGCSDILPCSDCRCSSMRSILKELELNTLEHSRCIQMANSLTATGR
jgi:hypothetical protein